MADLLRILVRALHRALAAGALDEAEATVARMESEAPLAVETRGARAELLLRQGRMQEAEPILEALLAHRPDSARVQLLAGRQRYAQRQYQAALNHFRQSERLHGAPVIERWIGKTLTQLGRFDEAAATLERLAEAGHDVLSDLAWLAERRGEFDRGIRLLDRRLQTRPDDEFASAQRARLQAKKLAPGEMIEEVDTMRALGVEVPESLLSEYVANLLRMGRSEDVRRLLAELAPTPPKLAGTLAWACHGQGKYDLAFELFLRGLPANLTYAKYFAAMEKAADLSGRIEDLLEGYERAAESHPALHGRIKRVRRRQSAKTK